MKRLYQRLVLLIGFTGFAISGCGSDGPPKVETSPVKGEILVDGKPVAGVTVVLHNLKAADVENDAQSNAHTDESGKFSVSTIVPDDGAPLGEFAVTFFWADAPLLGSGEDAKDKLNGRYASAGQSTFKIKVEKDKPVDMGKIELKTR